MRPPRRRRGSGQPRESAAAGLRSGSARDASRRIPNSHSRSRGPTNEGSRTASCARSLRSHPRLAPRTSRIRRPRAPRGPIVPARGDRRARAILARRPSLMRRPTFARRTPLARAPGRPVLADRRARGAPRAVSHDRGRLSFRAPHGFSRGPRSSRAGRSSRSARFFSAPRRVHSTPRDGLRRGPHAGARRAAADPPALRGAALRSRPAASPRPSRSRRGPRALSAAAAFAASRGWRSRTFGPAFRSGGFPVPRRSADGRKRARRPAFFGVASPLAAVDLTPSVLRPVPVAASLPPAAHAVGWRAGDFGSVLLCRRRRGWRAFHGSLHSKGTAPDGRRRIIRAAGAAVFARATGGPLPRTTARTSPSPLRGMPAAGGAPGPDGGGDRLSRGNAR